MSDRVVRSMFVMALSGAVFCACKAEGPAEEPTRAPARRAEDGARRQTERDPSGSPSTTTTTTDASPQTKVPVTGFLTAADLAPPASFETTDRQQIATIINSERAFLYDDEDGSGQSNDCYYSLFDASPITGDASRIELSVDVNTGVDRCFTTSQTKMVNGSLKYKLVLTCEGGDLSRFVGKRYSEVKDDMAEYCRGGRRAEMLYNMTLRGTYSFSSDPNPLSVDYQYIAADSSASGGACVANFESGTWVYQDCQTFSKTLYSNERGQGASGYFKNSYSLFNRSGLRARVDAHTYESGSMKFAINDLRGTMTYSPGQSPTWRLDDGSAQGTFTAQAAPLTLGAWEEGVGVVPLSYRP